MVNADIQNKRRQSRVQRQMSRMRRTSVALDQRTGEMLARVYLARRIEYQIEYYEQRIIDNDKKSDRFFRLGALVMTASSLFAALNTQSPSPELNMLITALPAVAALIASFRQLYQWERQAALYRDTVFGLEEARLLVPDMDQYNARKVFEVFPQLVVASEKVFEDEVNQWGQLARGNEKEDEEFDPLRAVAEQYGLDIFDEDGDVDESRIGQLGEILNAARSGDVMNVAQVLSIQTESGETATITRRTQLDGDSVSVVTDVEMDEDMAEALGEAGYAQAEAMAVAVDYEAGAPEVDSSDEVDTLVSDDYGPTDEAVFYEETAPELNLTYETDTLVSDDYGPTDEVAYDEHGNVIGELVEEPMLDEISEPTMDGEAEYVSETVTEPTMDGEETYSSEEITEPTMDGEEAMMNGNGHMVEDETPATVTEDDGEARG
ncbi:MAG: SLATT domain-containing protein [Aggregatilineales bacterium]